MSTNKAQALDLRFLPASVLAWLLAAVILLPLASFIAHTSKCGETVLAYISSALIFFTGLAAGVRAISLRKRKPIFTGLISGLSIVIIALTVGYLTGIKDLEADGILSLVTFTISGCICGALIFPLGFSKGRKITGPKPKLRKSR